jgi:hypothetical protein
VAVFVEWKFELLPCLTDEETLLLGTLSVDDLSEVVIEGPPWRSTDSRPCFKSEIVSLLLPPVALA